MDYREIARLQHSPVAVRSLARGLLSIRETFLSTKDRAFLGDLARIEDGVRITTLQGEYLLSLRDRAARKRVVASIRVSKLVADLWTARDDLDEDHVEWLGSLRAYGADLAVSDRQWARLCLLARQIGLIDDAYIPFTA
jgi:hypothetical protein